MRRKRDSYDYVIIGGGSAGSGSWCTPFRG